MTTQNQLPLANNRGYVANSNLRGSFSKKDPLEDRVNFLSKSPIFNRIVAGFVSSNLSFLANKSTSYLFIGKNRERKPSLAFFEKYFSGNQLVKKFEYVSEGWEGNTINPRDWLKGVVKNLSENSKDKFTLSQRYYFVVQEEGVNKVAGRNFLELLDSLLQKGGDLNVKLFVFEKDPYVGWTNGKEIKEFNQLQELFVKNHKSNDISSYLPL